jgi:hypothetical protein
MTDRSRLFYAGRSDGFGERLRAILNAMVLADHFGGRFGFHWNPKIGGQTNHHAIAEVTDTFSEKFVADHHIDKARLEAMHIVPLRSAMTFRASHDGTMPSDADAIEVDQTDVPRQGVAFPSGLDRWALIRRAWNDLTFSDTLEYARSRALAQPLPVRCVAIHLRAGDIVYGVFRMTDRFHSKVSPYPVAEEFIRRQIAKGVTPVIFGQDVDLCRYLRDRYGALLAHDMADAFGFDRNQQAMFDIVLMSRCQEIIAGNSGFAILASWVGGAKLINPQRAFSAKDMVAFIEQAIFSSDPAEGVSPLQRAFACRYALVVSGQHFPTEPRFQRLMDHARAMDPENGFYHLVQAAASYAAGDTQTGEALVRKMLGTRSDFSRILLAKKMQKGKHHLDPFIPVITQQAEMGSPGAALFAYTFFNGQGESDKAREYAALFAAHATPDLAALGERLIVPV